MRNHGELLLLLATAVWGTTFATISVALEQWHVLGIMAARFCIATLVLSYWLLPPRQDIVTFRRGCILGALGFVAFGLQTASLAYTSPSHSAFGTALVTVLTPLFAHFHSRTSFKLSTLIALAAAAWGVGLLLGGGLDDKVHLGDGMAVMCALVFSVQIIVLGRYAKQSPILPLAAAQTFCMAVLSLAALALNDTDTGFPPMSYAAWGPVLYLGVFATALCFVLQMAGQARTTATRACFIYALEPLFACALAWVWRGQTLGQGELAGGGLIIFASLIADRPIDRFSRLKTSQA